MQKIVSLFKDQMASGEARMSFAPLMQLPQRNYDRQMESLLLSNPIVDPRESESFLEGYDITEQLMQAQPKRSV